MITAFRILKEARIDSAFSGAGAAKNGGRWNRIGVPVVYLSSTRSLSVLETLVHLDSASIPLSFVCIPATFRKDQVEVLDLTRLPKNWTDSGVHELRNIGDEWLSSKRSIALQVPSVIIPQEVNFVLNPEHPEFSTIIRHGKESFCFDPRLK